MFLHPPLGPQPDQLSGLFHHIVYTWNRQLPATSHHCTVCESIFLHTVHWTEFACTPFPQTPQGHFPEFTIIFPPLLPTITLDFPAFTFNPLPSRLALQSATRLPSCSIVGAIITRSSAYSNSEGRPLLASLETTSMTAANNSGLSTDPWCKPTFTSKLSLSPAFVLTIVQASVYNAITVRMSHSSTPSFRKAHLTTSLGTLSNAFSAEIVYNSNNSNYSNNSI